MSRRILVLACAALTACTATSASLDGARVQHARPRSLSSADVVPIDELYRMCGVAFDLDGHLHGFLPGIGLLLERTGVPAVPVWIEGTFEAWPPGQRLPRPHPVSIRIGTPVQLAWVERAGTPLPVFELQAR